MDIFFIKARDKLFFFSQSTEFFFIKALVKWSFPVHPKEFFFINAVKFLQPSQRIFFYKGRGSAGVFPVSQWKSFLQKKIHLPQVIHFSLKNCINITTNISVRLSVPYIFLFRGKFVLTNSSTPSMQPVRNLRQMPEFSSVFWFFFYRPGCTGYPAGRISGLNYIRYPARYGIWVMTARYPAG